MKKRFLRIAAAGLAMALLTACGAQSKETEENLLHVGFLKAGKADAIVLWQGTEALLIDTGEDEDGEKLLSYMKSWGIKTVSAMIITHFDKDHVGGADHILESMGAERILQPDYEGDGKQYRQYVEALPD